MATDRIITDTVETSGEVIEYHLATASDVTKALNDVESHIKAYSRIRQGVYKFGMELLTRKGDGNGHSKQDN